MLASQPYHSNRNHRLQARPSKMKRNWLSALTDNKNIAYYSEIVAASQLRSVRSVCILQDNLVQPPFFGMHTLSNSQRSYYKIFIFYFWYTRFDDSVIQKSKEMAELKGANYNTYCALGNGKIRIWEASMILWQSTQSLFTDQQHVVWERDTI